MRLHYLQHVPFENLSNIEPWAHNKKFTLSKTDLFKNEPLPRINDLDWLIVLGGPMNIYEDHKYPWLKPEKKLIEQAISAGKPVLGVCLGAQLIADVLGARVYQNPYKEIGWFPVKTTPEARLSAIFEPMPKQFMAFHWHGDTFDLPKGAKRMAETDGCANQAFEYDNHVIGLQFHLESNLGGVRRLLQNCGDELVEGKYIQTERFILSQQNVLLQMKNQLNSLMDNFLRAAYN